MLEACFESLNDVGSVGAQSGNVQAAQIGCGECDWQQGLQFLEQHLSRSKSRSDLPGDRGGKLVIPGLARTPPGPRQLMMAVLLGQWNFEFPEGSCCSFHAGTLALQRAVSDLQSLSCKGVQHSFSYQCQACGLLCENNCDLCQALQDAAEEVKVSVTKPWEVSGASPASDSTPTHIQSL